MTADDELLAAPEDPAKCGAAHQDGYTCTFPRDHGGYQHYDALGMASWPTGLTPEQESRSLRIKLEAVETQAEAMRQALVDLTTHRAEHQANHADDPHCAACHPYLFARVARAALGAGAGKVVAGSYAWCKSYDRQSGEDGPPFLVRVVAHKGATVHCTSNLHPDAARDRATFGVGPQKLSPATHADVVKTLCEERDAERRCATEFHEQLRSMGATVVDVTGASLDAIGYHGGFSVTAGPDHGGSHPWGVVGHGPNRLIDIARCPTRESAGVIARLLVEADSRRPEETQ